MPLGPPGYAAIGEGLIELVGVGPVLTRTPPIEAQTQGEEPSEDLQE